MALPAELVRMQAHPVAPQLMSRLLSRSLISPIDHSRASTPFGHHKSSLTSILLTTTVSLCVSGARAFRVPMEAALPLPGSVPAALMPPSLGRKPMGESWLCVCVGGRDGKGCAFCFAPRCVRTARMGARDCSEGDMLDCFAVTTSWCSSFLAVIVCLPQPLGHRPPLAVLPPVPSCLYCFYPLCLFRVASGHECPPDCYHANSRNEPSTGCPV
jgi:hypothetical protein